MKKKFLSGMLALFTACALFPLAACKPKTETGGGTGGNTNDGGTTDQGTVIAPGTVLTDEKTKEEIFSSLSAATFGGFTYSASASLSVTSGETTSSQKIFAEGGVLLGESVSADVFAYAKFESGEETGEQYLMAFVRQGTAYSQSGDLDEGQTADFNALKASLKDKEDPLLLNKEELSGGISAILKKPAAAKILKNMPSLFEGTIKKTEGGYEMSFDLGAGTTKLLETVTSLASAVDEDKTMTLGSLFARPELKPTLEKLLAGVTAGEIRDLLTLLPEEIAEALPEAAKNATAVSYVETLLRSGAFYEAITGGEEPYSKFKTFAETPVLSLAEWISGGEISEEFKFKEIAQKFQTELKTKAISLLAEIVGLEGDISDESLTLLMGFEFDEEKKLLGFSLEGEAGGKVALAEQEGPEQGPEQGSDGSEGSDSGTDGQDPNDGSEGGSDSETVSKRETSKKSSVRGTVKLRAACASALELFSLEGCRYETEEGSAPVKLK